MKKIMKPNKILIPFSGLPPHVGHWYMVKKTRKIYPESIIYVACLKTNKKKKHLFNLLDENDYNECFHTNINDKNIHFIVSNDNVTKLCEKYEINLIIRGIRNDYCYEFFLWLYHVLICMFCGIYVKTVFIYGENKNISSSNLRNELSKLNGNCAIKYHSLADEYKIPVYILRKIRKKLDKITIPE